MKAHHTKQHMKENVKNLRFSTFLPRLFIYICLFATPAGSALATVEIITTASTSPWTAPTNIYSVSVECWGGGGGGAGDGDTAGNGVAGGGGGAYAKTQVSVTPGNTYAFSVGTGGAGGNNGADGVAGNNTTFNSTSCVADAGEGGTEVNVGGSGGLGSNSTGDTTQDGGDGAASGGQDGGGGGASAGSAFAGTDATDVNGATAPTDGGDGGDGGSGLGVNGNAATQFGGGGGGSGDRNGGSEDGGAGAAGQIRLTYSADVIYSGTLYSDEGNTTITAGRTIKMAVGTSTPATVYSTTTDPGTGNFHFSIPIGGSEISATTSMVIWVDGATVAAMVLNVDGVAPISGLDLYENRVIIRSEGDNPVNIIDMAVYDNGDDADIPYSVTTGSATSTIIFAGNELHIWDGGTFAPGGEVTVAGNAGSGTDGSLHLHGEAVFSAGGTTTIAGSLLASSTSYFFNKETLFFNATTTGKTIDITMGTSTLGNVVFSGSGGGWTFANNASTSNFTINSGATVIAPSGLTIDGSYENNGTFTHSSGEVHLQGSTTSGTMTGDSAFNNLIVDSAGDGSEWATSSAAEANTWASVTYGNGLFVAVSQTGTNQVMTSSDGITWTAHAASEANTWASVTYGNGLFVAVSTTGTNRVMTSPDGINWTARSAAEANAWGAVTYGNGLFVAVAQGGANQVMTSPDGITWTARSAAEANTWRSVTYGNGTFVAVSSDGTNQVMTSPDGITWATRSSATKIWYSVTYSNNLFVVVGTASVMTSPDGITWTARSAAEANTWRSVTYGNGTFVAVSSDGTNRVMTSPDGITWAARSAAEANQWYGITYGNGRFVATSLIGTNRVMTSTFGTTTFSNVASTTGTMTIDGGGDTVVFPAAATSTFTNIDWQGDVADELKLRSSTPGTQWGVVTTGSQTVDYVDANDSNACDGNDIYYTNSTISNVSCWISNNALTISGTLYSDEGTTQITAGRTINMILGADTPEVSATTTDSGAGTFTFTTLQASDLAGNKPIIIYVKDATTTQAAVVTKASTSPSSITDLDLYEDRVIVRHESTDAGASTTIADMASYFGATATVTLPYAASSTRSTLDIQKGMELHVWAGDTFAPDGSVYTEQSPTTTTNVFHIDDSATFTAGGTTTIQGGELQIDTGATFIAPATEPLYIDGPYENQGTFTHNSGEITLRGNIASGTMTGTEAFNNLIVDAAGDGSEWSVQSAANTNTWSSVTYGNGLFVAVATGGDTNRVMTSPDGIDWTARAATESSIWTDVTYGNGLFVAVSGNGTDRVMTSSDGITWTERTEAEENFWSSVTYGNGTFVAVSQGGTNPVMTSPDGITWTARSAPESNNWYSVTYGNGLFVAVAYTGTNRIMTSPDGITWTARAATGANVWHDVTYGNGLFVAVSCGYNAAVCNITAGDDRVMTSPDGITWTARAEAGVSTWDSVTYGNGLFVAVADTSGTNRVMTSPDGITWTARSHPEDNQWRGLTYGNGTFVAVSSSGTNRVMTSSAGGSLAFLNSASTTDLTIAEDEAVLPRELTISGDYTNNGTVYHNDGTTTFDSASAQAINATTTGESALYNVVFNGAGTKTFNANASTSDFTINSGATVVAPAGLTIAGDYENNGTFTHSSGEVHLQGSTTSGTMTGDSAFNNLIVDSAGDGSEWATSSAAEANAWYSVTYGNGLFVAVSTTGTNRVMTSPDGINWTARAAAELNLWQSVTYGNGLFVAVSCGPFSCDTTTTNRVMTSPDGITWTSRVDAEDNSWYSVTYGNGLFVAVSGDGTNRVMTSPDGITWTARAVEASGWTSVSYGNGLFVAVANSGTNRVMTSSDGITWIARSAAEANGWISVTYGNGLFAAVAPSGTNRVMTSPDGINWIGRTAAAASVWFSITYGNGLFTAVSGFGTNRVMTSPDGINWTAHTAAEENTWRTVTYGDGMFVAASNDGTNRVMTSTFGTTTFSNVASTTGTMTIDGGGDTVAFPASATSTFTNIDWQGDVADELKLRSSTPGTQWGVVTTGSQTVDYVDAADSNACDGNDIIYTNSTISNVSCWSVEGVITISGTLYSDEGSTQITAERTINLILGKSTPTVSASTTNSGTGAFTLEIAESSLPGNTPIIIYVKDSSTTSAATITKASTSPSSITDLDLYEDRVIVRHESTDAGASTTIADMASYFGATATVTLPYAASSTRSTLDMQKGMELHVWAGDTFAPDGTVTTHQSPTTTPNVLHIDDGATFVASATTTIEGGNLVIDSGATFIAPSTDPLYIVGDYENSGTFTHNSGDITLRGSVASGTMTGTSAFNNVTVDAAGDGSEWVARSEAEANRWYGITYGNGLFVAVSDNGTNRVMTSPDGINWTARSAAEANFWYSVTYGNGLFVAVSYDGTNRVMTSPDGINWTARSAAEANQWLSVTYGNGLFVAVSDNGTNRVMTSPDGINWTARAAAEANGWLSVTYGNGLFVAVSYGGTNRVMTSPDGINWTARSAAEANGWRAITYGNGMFVATSGDGTNRVMTSPDGINWTARSAAEANFWYSVTYGNGLFVAAACGIASTCNQTAGGNRVMTSPDGITWTARAAAEANRWYGIAYGKGVFVGVAFDGTNQVMTSSAGGSLAFLNSASTTDLTIAEDEAVLPRELTISGDYTNNGTVYHNDGTTTFDSASAQAINATTTGESALYNVVFNGAGTKTFNANASTSDLTINSGATVVAPAGLTIAGDYENNGTFTHSSGEVHLQGSTTSGTMTGDSAFNNLIVDSAGDGSEWATSTPAELSTWHSVAYGNDLFVSVAKLGTNRVMTSPDGITWATSTAAELNSWSSVTYGNGLFVAVEDGSDNEVMTSPDGITWATSTAAAANNWNSVTYGNGMFVAVADSGTNRVMRSSDGINWATSSAEANNWNSVTYGNGMFVAVSSNGTNRAMTSPDGITWTARAVEASTWQDVTYGNGLFVAVANFNTNRVITSPDGIDWTVRTAAEANTWTTVTYGNGVFVALSGNGTNQVMTSSDGISWAPYADVGISAWQDVTYGNGTFVAVANNNTERVMISSFGTTTFQSNASTSDFSISESGDTVVAPSLLSIDGDYTNDGIFTAGSGTTTLNGTAVQTASGTMTGTSAFNNLEITNTSQNGTTSQSVVFSTVASTTGTFTMNASTSAQFPANATSTFTNIYFDGAAESPVWLRSSIEDTQWGIENSGTQYVSYVNVQDSNACDGNIIAAGATGDDGGNNSCWTFEVSASAAISSATNQSFSTAYPATTISSITITDNETPTITSANDIRIVIASTTVDMLWDTTDTTAAFGGTASAKVSGPVAYEGGGSILVIPVDTDFDASDTLTIDNLSLTSFGATNTAATALSLRTEGAGDLTDESTDDKTVTIGGGLTLAESDGGQASDAFNRTNENDEDLYAFKLTPADETFTISTISFNLTGVRKIENENLTGLTLYRDIDGDGVVDAGEPQIGGAGTPSISDTVGSISFATSWTATTSQNYILEGDYNGVRPGASMTIDLDSITGVGVLTSAVVNSVGSISSQQHSRGGGGGGNSTVGGSAPEGDGDVGGGEEEGGEEIGSEPGFNPPTGNNLPHGQWENPTNAFASDGTYASSSVAADQQSYNSFSTSVPGTDTIDGIEVKLEVRGSTAAGTIDIGLSWNAGTGVTTVKSTPTLSTSDVVYTLGSPSDLWGRTWTASEFSDANFRVRAISQASGNTVQIDAIQVRVYHSATGGGGGGGGDI